MLSVFDFVMSIGTSVTGIVLYIVYVAGLWKIFVSMGIEGWKSIIPIYNSYILGEKVWDSKFIIYFWGIVAVSWFINVVANLGGLVGLLFGIISFLLGVVAFVLRARFCYYISKAFGHDIGFAVGLLFFPFIFILIIAYGNSNYMGNYYKETGMQY